MAGIVGQGTTYNLPNFVGELFLISPTDTPILSAIGGLTGGEQAKAKVFEWEFYDLREADDSRQRVEGADAPTPEERVRAYGSNVLEIHQEAVEVSYTKQGATAQLASDVLTAGAGNPVNDEMAFQIAASMKQVARDVEKTFITGTFQNPANNSTPRKTRGLLEAIVTNVNDLAGGDLTEAALLDSMQDAWVNGGLAEEDTRVLVTNATQKRALTRIFIKEANFRQTDRNVAGVSVTSIETDFGTLNVMLDRFMPSDALLILSMEELSPVFLEIPGRGHFFWEPLAKTGAADRSQLYGEIGLDYGNEMKHAKIIGASVPSASS